VAEGEEGKKDEPVISEYAKWMDKDHGTQYDADKGTVADANEQDNNDNANEQNDNQNEQNNEAAAASANINPAAVQHQDATPQNVPKSEWDLLMFSLKTVSLVPMWTR
jgi:hypothetical protein